MQFTQGQLDRLSNLCLDIAKAMFITSLAGPVVISAITMMNSLRILFLGIGFTYISLFIQQAKEQRK